MIANRDTSSEGPSVRDDVRIGLAGWSYRDWEGPFYPAGTRREKQLRFAAETFDCLEINSSFYRPIAAKTAANWVRSVADLPRLEFTAKLWRRLTHERPDDVPAAAREFLEGMKPLSEANRLGCIVLQFPWYFRDSPESRDHIRRLRDELHPLPLAIEVRHRSFFDSGGALPFFGDLGINFINIDLPRNPDSPPPSSITTGSIGYFRLHGRNAKAWFDRTADRDQKYDYLYKEGELKELLPLILRVAERTRTTYVITNNHFRGQAPANAVQLARYFGQEPRTPDTLLSEYPFLRIGATS
ncbi:MAG: DUF72 domain-containing protein [Planctomycetota bacterium]